MRQIFYDKFGSSKIAGLNSKLFYFGLALKIALAAFFASDYLTKLFIPFLNHFVNAGFSDPYQYFFELGQTNVFPYPSLMLWLMAIPKLLFSWLSSSTQLNIFIYRLPILAADLCILVILLRWLKAKNKEVLIFYWLSPVLIYINYIHGQLDAIPMALVFVSMYFLFKEKFSVSAIFLAAAAACKTHILILIPFFFFYALKNRHEKSASLKAAITFLATFFLLLSPYLSSKGFWQIVFENNQQGKIFDLSFSFASGLVFYLIPAIYIFLVAKSFSFKSYNRDIFIMFLGFAFGILTVFIPPMQGWYYWIMPFFIYFFIKETRAPLLFISLNICYFLHFAFHPQSDFLQVLQFINAEFASSPNLYHALINNGFNEVEKISSLVFTTLQTVLLLSCVSIYRSGIQSNLQIKLKSEPYLIGVGGDSGAGKTTYSKLLEKVFSLKNTTTIRGDDMHKYERGHDMWQIYTHLNPKANDLHSDMEDALKLKQGKIIQRRHYDHKDGKFTLPKQILSNKVVIVEGLLPFYLSQMRALYDLKIFIMPDEELRKEWKLNRDQAKRGHSSEKILKQIEDRAEDSEKYIQAQAKYADLIISFSDDAKTLSLSCSNHINAEKFINYINELSPELKIEQSYNEEKQLISFSGEISAEKIEYIAYQIIPELEELILEEPSWEKDLNGLLQLFSTYIIFEKMKLEQKLKN